jgi:hypothetical protein
MPVTHMFQETGQTQPVIVTEWTDADGVHHKLPCLDPDQWPPITVEIVVDGVRHASLVSDGKMDVGIHDRVMYYVQQLYRNLWVLQILLPKHPYAWVGRAQRGAADFKQLLQDDHPMPWLYQHHELHILCTEKKVDDKEVIRCYHDI